MPINANDKTAVETALDNWVQATGTGIRRIVIHTCKVELCPIFKGDTYYRDDVTDEIICKDHIDEYIEKKWEDMKEKDKFELLGIRCVND